MSTVSAKPHEVTRDWFVVDATDMVVGRLCTRIATVLMGKHKPSYTPHVDTGDFVIVVNADKVVFTGRKLAQKRYFSHSGWFGSERLTPAGELLERHPERVVEKAVRRMLPKNRLARQMVTKLKVYAGPEHPHQAQQPKPFPDFV